jgi:hypothetical protein
MFFLRGTSGRFPINQISDRAREGGRAPARLRGLYYPAVRGADRERADGENHHALHSRGDRRLALHSQSCRHAPVQLAERGAARLSCDDGQDQEPIALAEADRAAAAAAIRERLALDKECPGDLGPLKSAYAELAPANDLPATPRITPRWDQISRRLTASGPF